MQSVVVRFASVLIAPVCFLVLLVEETAHISEMRFRRDGTMIIKTRSLPVIVFVQRQAREYMSGYVLMPNCKNCQIHEEHCMEYRPTIQCMAKAAGDCTATTVFSCDFCLLAQDNHRDVLELHLHWNSFGFAPQLPLHCIHLLDSFFLCTIGS